MTSTANTAARRSDYELVSEWSHIQFEVPTPLVPRREVRLGDFVQSSHGYKGYVAEAYTAGTGPTGGTTQLTIELHSKGSGVFRNERYDATSTIPVLIFNDRPAQDDPRALNAWSMSERDLRTKLAALANGTVEPGSIEWSATRQTVIERVAGLLDTIDTLRDALSAADDRQSKVEKVCDWWAEAAQSERTSVNGTPECRARVADEIDGVVADVRSAIAPQAD